MGTYFRGFLMSVSMFTIIPIPNLKWDDDAVKHLLKFYPLVGCIVGGVWFLIYKVLQLFNISLMLKAAIILVIPYIITGMLHLDGYMDVCDAMLCRRNKEEMLRILKDPNTGAFSVISLVLMMVINFASTYSFLEKGVGAYILLLIPIISRGLAGFLLLQLETLKGSSLGAYFKKGTGIIDKVVLIGAMIIAIIIMIGLYGFKGLIIGISMVLITLILVLNSYKKLGGMNGDIAGYCLTICEFVGMLTVALCL